MSIVKLTKGQKRARRKTQIEEAVAEVERLKAKAERRELYARPAAAPLPAFIKALSEKTIAARPPHVPVREPMDPAMVDRIRAARIAKQQAEEAKAQSFYLSLKWEVLRRNTLRRYGLKCMRCEASGVKLHVDHIKPRSRYPELELDPDNLQVLCEPCNSWKSNLYETDFRPKRETKDSESKPRAPNRKPRQPRQPRRGRKPRRPANRRPKLCSA